MQNRVTDRISTFLLATNGFVNPSHPEQTRRCNEAVNSVINVLTSLSNEYKTILPPQKRRIALGQLLSSSLLYMNTSLSVLEDIAADESTFLIELYKKLFMLEGLFSPFEPSQVCSEWLRSQYIRELLDWRMVDIMESWKEGLLQGIFSADEMVGWIRRLFQDSDVRARNIATILNG